MSQLSWPWLGGFFDGEGCISVVKANYRVPDGAEVIRLQIHQKTVEILDDITEFIYAEIGAVPYLGESRGNHYLQYHRSADVISILLALTPHLRVKHEFAKEALEYMQALKKLRDDYGMHWRKNENLEVPAVPVRARLRRVG